MVSFYFELTLLLRLFLGRNQQFLLYIRLKRSMDFLEWFLLVDLCAPAWLIYLKVSCCEICSSRSNLMQWSYNFFKTSRPRIGAAPAAAWLVCSARSIADSLILTLRSGGRHAIITALTELVWLPSPTMHTTAILYLGLFCTRRVEEQWKESHIGMVKQGRHQVRWPSLKPFFQKSYFCL
jgi:hypothetical protein